ncbi:hypothetical protein VTK56DRAFT_3644 [Thermocarpiscus australiensis]
MSVIYQYMPLLAAFAFAPSAAYGHRFSGRPSAPPTYTGRMPDFALGLGPAPTPYHVDAAAIPGLLKRDDSKTCAYIFGASDGAVTCDPGYTCSTHSTGSVFHCCTTGSGDCYMPTACLDHSAYLGGACSNQGSSTTCCSDTATPYCASIGLVDKPSVSLVGCFDFKSYIPVYATPTDTTTTTSTSSPSLSTTRDESTSQSRPTSTTITPTPTPTPSPDNAPLPVGAIVGGVIGGVAIIAVTAGVIAWFVIRSRRQQGGGTASQGQGLGQQPHQPVFPGPAMAQYYGHAGQPSNMQPSPPPEYDRNAWAHESWGAATVMGMSPTVGGSGPGSPGLAGAGAGAAAGAGGFYQSVQTAAQGEQRPVSTLQQAQQEHGQGQGWQSEYPHYKPGMYAAELPDNEGRQGPGPGQGPGQGQ